MGGRGWAKFAENLRGSHYNEDFWYDSRSNSIDSGFNYTVYNYGGGGKKST
jgi:hypothetical protein